MSSTMLPWSINVRTSHVVGGWLTIVQGSGRVGHAIVLLSTPIADEDGVIDEDEAQGGETLEAEGAGEAGQDEADRSPLPNPPQAGPRSRRRTPAAADA